MKKNNILLGLFVMFLMNNGFVSAMDFDVSVDMDNMTKELNEMGNEIQTKTQEMTKEMKKAGEDVKTKTQEMTKEMKKAGEDIVNNLQETRLNNSMNVRFENNKDGKKKITLMNKDKKINISDSVKVEVKNGELFLNQKKLKVEAQKAIEKAKDATDDATILDTLIESDDDGNINYLIKTKKKTKFLWLFGMDLESEVKINVETGEVEDIDTPWYSFLLF